MTMQHLVKITTLLVKPSTRSLRDACAPSTSVTPALH